MPSSGEVAVMHMIRRRAVQAACFVLVLAVSVLVRTSGVAQSLPTRISDETFWGMVSDFSEEDGYFRFENFLSNELGFQSVIPALQRTTKADGVYLGVGPEQNFTHLVAIRPKIAFIIDIRRQNVLEHLMYKALFEMSADRADFVSRLFSRKRPPGLTDTSTVQALFNTYVSVKPDQELFNKNLRSIRNFLLKENHFGLTAEDERGIEYTYNVFFNAGPDLDYSFGGFGGGWGSPSYADLMTAEDNLGQNRSYLATEQNFRLVRDMQRKNLIVPLVGDFAGPKAIRRVGQYVRDHNAAVTVFYLSNVERYLFEQSNEWRRFYANVATLPLDASSTFIRSINNGEYYQHYQAQASGMRFQSLSSSMSEVIRAFNEGRIRSYYDVIEMSR